MFWKETSASDEQARSRPEESHTFQKYDSSWRARFSLYFLVQLVGCVNQIGIDERFHAGRLVLISMCWARDFRAFPGVDHRGTGYIPKDRLPNVSSVLWLPEIH